MQPHLTVHTKTGFSKLELTNRRDNVRYHRRLFCGAFFSRPPE